MAAKKKNQTKAEQIAEEQKQEDITPEAEQADEKKTPVEELEQADEEETPIKEPESDEFVNIPNPCVYCGPSVRGVARQYTTYMGGIPEPLKEFIREHPTVRGLIVSTAQFASVRKRLETPGTAEAIVYKKVKSEL